MPVGNPSNFQKDDLIQGTIDLDDEFITDAWLVDQFVGNQLFTCGYNNKGQLGNITTTNYSSPIQIGSLTNWKQVSAGFRHTAAIKTDGTLWTCGYNSSGQLGNGIRINYSSPIQIGSLTNWKQVAAGYTTTAAIKTDNTLWAWGGDGFTSYSSPIQVGSLTNWKQIAVSSVTTRTTAAIKTDGTLWTWGYNTYGQLGNGTTTDYSSPIQVGALTNWKQVACGHHTAAIKTDGTLWTWGYNTYGQLGNGTSAFYSSPIQVGSLTNWKQISVGQYYTAAIKTDGTLWTWGYNTYGGLGNNTSLNHYSSPIQVGSLTTWKQVSCGNDYGYMAAIKTDGTLWAWGTNSSGELGNGTSASAFYSSPIQVGSLTTWKQVSAGDMHIAYIPFADIT